MVAPMGQRVLIVDDHAGFRSHARRFLECEGYSVAGEAADCASGLETARELKPDLVLVDVYLPDADGFELAARLDALPDPPAVVLTSSHDGCELRSAVAASGACGFVPKSELSREAIEVLLP
jgi:DNA-binding NarL/FixJ family response regulator